MCKVEIFSAENDLLLESDINRWIASHRTIVIKNVSFSYVADDSSNSDGKYKAMVLYEI